MPAEASREYMPPAGIYGLYAAMALAMPLSIELSVGKGWTLLFPTELFIGAAALYLAIGVWKNPKLYWHRLRNNSFIVTGALWVVWQWVCTAASTMPLVSFKYMLVETAHWWVFGLGLAAHPGLFQRLLPWFRASMLLIVGWFVFRYAQTGFRTDQAILAPMPFFPDNNLYAAVIASLPWGSFAVLPFNAVVLFLSASRGALFSWTAGLFFAVLPGGGFATKFQRAIWTAAGIAGLLLLLNLDFLIQKAKTDVSLAERFNRFDCAVEMGFQKPVSGFGPGTFSFQYFPFQKEELKTRISLDRPVAERSPDTYGRGGGAHSEYLQALSETGWPGFLLWSGWWLWAVVGGWTAVRNAPPDDQKNLRFFWIALFAFALHGMANNFFHDARIAFLCWGAGGVLFSSVSAPTLPHSKPPDGRLADLSP